MTTMLASVGRIALDLLYPPRCAVCGRNGSLLCEACLAELPRTVGHRCDDCWLPLRDGIACHACAAHPLVLQRLRSALRYDGQVRHLVKAFKFAGQSSLAPSLAKPLIETYETQGLRADVIVPVPLTGLGKRLRGYNQAALLANELSKATGVPCTEALSRIRSVKEQARSASAEERRRNVVSAFAVRKRDAVAGRAILLIDDVATTGATLDACARELLAAGASSVNALTLARED
jgi:ComF family protein